MFAYCGNNPVSRFDLVGTFWNKVCNLFKSIFGAGATKEHQIKQEIEYVPPIVNLLVTYKTGVSETKIISKKGDSSKPISVYAKGRSDNELLSSVGLNININKFQLNVSLGLDDIGIKGSWKNNNEIYSFGLKAQTSQLKIGFEGSRTVIADWDPDVSVTTYGNGSITLFGILAVLRLVTTGDASQIEQSLQPSY